MPQERKSQNPLLHPVSIILAGYAATSFALGGWILYERETFDDSVNNRSNNLAAAARSLETVPTDPDQAQIAVENTADVIGDEGPIDDILREISAKIEAEHSLPQTSQYELGLIRTDLEEKSEAAQTSKLPLGLAGVFITLGTISAGGAGTFAVVISNKRKEAKTRKTAIA